MKLQKILSNFQRLHPKEIDLSLDRIKSLCEKKLGNPQDKIKVISVCGTNGKGSTIESLYAILKEANFKCNVFKSSAKHSSGLIPSFDLSQARLVLFDTCRLRMALVLVPNLRLAL